MCLRRRRGGRRSWRRRIWKKVESNGPLDILRHTIKPATTFVVRMPLVSDETVDGGSDLRRTLAELAERKTTNHLHTSSIYLRRNVQLSHCKKTIGLSKVPVHSAEDGEQGTCRFCRWRWWKGNERATIQANVEALRSETPRGEGTALSPWARISSLTEAFSVGSACKVDQLQHRQYEGRKNFFTFLSKNPIRPKFKLWEFDLVPAYFEGYNINGFRGLTTLKNSARVGQREENNPQ